MHYMRICIGSNRQEHTTHLAYQKKLHAAAKRASRASQSQIKLGSIVNAMRLDLKQARQKIAEDSGRLKSLRRVQLCLSTVQHSRSPTESNPCSISACRAVLSLASLLRFMPQTTTYNILRLRFRLPKCRVSLNAPLLLAGSLDR